MNRKEYEALKQGDFITPRKDVQPHSWYPSKFIAGKPYPCKSNFGVGHRSVLVARVRGEQWFIHDVALRGWRKVDAPDRPAKSVQL